MKHVITQENFEILEQQLLLPIELAVSEDQIKASCYDGSIGALYVGKGIKAEEVNNQLEFLLSKFQDSLKADFPSVDGSVFPKLLNVFKAAIDELDPQQANDFYDKNKQDLEKIFVLLDRKEISKNQKQQVLEKLIQDIKEQVLTETADLIKVYAVYEIMPKAYAALAFMIPNDVIATLESSLKELRKNLDVTTPLFLFHLSGLIDI